MTDAARLLFKLRERWPQAFCDPPRPLPLGVLAELHRTLYPTEHGRNWEFTANARALASALAAWCSQRAYFEACVTPRTPRYGLDGAVRGEVSEAQAAFARASLARLDEARSQT